jgi:hypothetical protein
MAAIGPFGGVGGGSFDDNPASQVRKVAIYSGTYIDKIILQYADDTTSSHGGPGGELLHPPLELGDGEFLNGVEGAYDQYLNWIVFTTSANRTFGPFGVASGRTFILTQIPGFAITSFFGRSGVYVDALGFYIQKVG